LARCRLALATTATSMGHGRLASPSAVCWAARHGNADRDDNRACASSCASARIWTRISTNFITQRSCHGKRSVSPSVWSCCCSQPQLFHSTWLLAQNWAVAASRALGWECGDTLFAARSPIQPGHTGTRCTARPRLPLSTKHGSVSTKRSRPCCRCRACICEFKGCSRNTANNHVISVTRCCLSRSEQDTSVHSVCIWTTGRWRCRRCCYPSTRQVGSTRSG